ncbi:ROK family transcriptional regulator [Maritalea porphyrae]|jgi:predicted NBD/HSP70 family sugar kinase|uniref:ROK family transcriptional regulator n=1 Tax=Maritalea porphyrae TaxID=880732 RepID=UPI0022AFBDDF|nr:ROK family transcriptional regulator [Maritalea porphyrae]MCZ4271291.1 ROK family transcriptional regulator [Maritalea porphyrae]
MTEAANNIRKLNKCSVFETIAHEGPISRAAIAKRLGLSKQTLSEVVKQLEDEGWVRQVGLHKGSVGRAAMNYEVVPDAAFVAAVDLGGTNVRVAIADLSCTIFGDASEKTSPNGGRDVVKQVAELCRSVMAERELPLAKLRLVVVGVPGVPDAETGAVLMAPNIAHLDEIDFNGELRAELGVDVIVENDVNLAVLGEHWGGIGHGFDDIAYIAIGTGIGAGIMVGGELVRGKNGSAGELGYLPFGADPFDEESLRQGALERATATDAIRAHYKKLTGEQLQVPEIFDRLNEDENARIVLDSVAKEVARACATIMAITDPEQIIFGGSIGRRTELFERVKLQLARISRSTTELGISGLGGRAALIGAASVGLSQVHATLLTGGIPGAEISLPPAKLSKLEALVDG